MSEWIVINGHVLGQCPYLDSDFLTGTCDCRELLDDEDESFWYEDEELAS